ncbi:putative zinc finger (CCCH type) protein [Neospora caninum Liverpool]|uniref:Putative zinc finger (CCCH type) protein n=1 Tax=Neospora caninum (strain Liverpool) TaxID=572307 RepID=F0VMY7_NEOCL|nr:putative zinc finger (CCCH type) protein [Neospora caninum Liverpool]CBZ55083.1 putative zinc finger (CCCH type) protein [Neospora caninum Liverpool]CEL69807.1 TPA: zinc finger (CCCH type) protein, putative [Neospora caninum Liverpool]|eukprot:XP_003885111.1 putative zinc finger (CCCH type) protein [Neospora caninum Liverpool]
MCAEAVARRKSEVHPCTVEMEGLADVTCIIRSEEVSEKKWEEDEMGRCASGSGQSNATSTSAGGDGHGCREDGPIDGGVDVGCRELKRRPRLKRMKLQFYKTKMCPWMAQGRCLRGLTCQYAHSECELSPLPNLVKTRMCELLTLTGSCPRLASECKFAHTADELRSTEIFARSKMCPLFLSGRCTANENCRYAHSAQELRKASVASALFLQKHPCRHLQANKSVAGTGTGNRGCVTSTNDTILAKKKEENTTNESRTDVSPSSSTTARDFMSIDAHPKFTLRYSSSKSDMTPPVRSFSRRPYSGIPIQRRLMPSVFLCSASGGDALRRLSSCSEAGGGSLSLPSSPKDCAAPGTPTSLPGGGRQMQAIARFYPVPQPPPPDDSAVAVLPTANRIIPSLKEAKACKQKPQLHSGVPKQEDGARPHIGDRLQKYPDRKGRKGSGWSLSGRGTSCSSSRTSLSSLGFAKDSFRGQTDVFASHTEGQGYQRRTRDKQEGPSKISETGTPAPRKASFSETGVETAGSQMQSELTLDAVQTAKNETACSQAGSDDRLGKQVTSPASSGAPRFPSEGQTTETVDPLASTSPATGTQNEEPNRSEGGPLPGCTPSTQEQASNTGWREQQSVQQPAAPDRMPLQRQWRSFSARSRNRGGSSRTSPLPWLAQDRSRQPNGLAVHSNGRSAPVVAIRRSTQVEVADLSRPASGFSHGGTRKPSRARLAGGNAVNLRQLQRPVPTAFVRPVFASVAEQTRPVPAWNFVQTGGYPGSSTPDTWPFSYEGIPGTPIYPCEQSLSSFPYVPDSRLASPDSCMSRTSFSTQSSGSTVATPHGMSSAPYPAAAAGSLLMTCQSRAGNGEAEQGLPQPSVQTESTIRPAGRVILYGSADQAACYSGGCGVGAAFPGGMDRQRQVLYLPHSTLGQSMQSLPLDVILPKLSAEVLKASEPDRYED